MVVLSLAADTLDLDSLDRGSTGPCEQWGVGGVSFFSSSFSEGVVSYRVYSTFFADASAVDVMTIVESRHLLPLFLVFVCRFLSVVCSSLYRFVVSFHYCVALIDDFLHH